MAWLSSSGKLALGFYLIYCLSFKGLQNICNLSINSFGVLPIVKDIVNFRMFFNFSKEKERNSQEINI
jgi:hypothetical protein